MMMKEMLIILMLFFQSCGNKFVMSNMLGDDNVDVSRFVHEGYKPLYCDGRIYKLINNKPDFSLAENLDFLDKEIKGWLKDNGYTENYSINDSNSNRDVVYQYSYSLTDHPIDVYSIKISVLSDGSSKMLYFRKDKNILLTPINSSGWVFSKCDKED